MPIYKIYRNGVEERRSRRILARWRWAAVLVSAVLLAMTAAMLISRHAGADLPDGQRRLPVVTDR